MLESFSSSNEIGGAMPGQDQPSAFGAKDQDPSFPDALAAVQVAGNVWQNAPFRNHC